MLTLTPLEDKAALERIYADPWITKVGHDHRPAAPIYHTAARYLGAHVHGALVGAFLVIESGFIELDLHALLSQKALPWCREFGRMCLDYAFGMAHIQRVSANVLEGLEAARNYCLHIGFKLEGFKRDAAQVGGKLVGIHMLGMTRREWSAA
jgi:hypothetical protein